MFKATQSAARPVFRQQVRKMSGDFTRADGPAVRQQSKEWMKYTVPVVGGIGAFAVYRHFAHHEHADHSIPGKPYQNYQAKSYPWQFPECTFFDPECRKIAKKTGKGVHH